MKAVYFYYTPPPPTSHHITQSDHTPDSFLLDLPIVGCKHQVQINNTYTIQYININS